MRPSTVYNLRISSNNDITYEGGEIRRKENTGSRRANTVAAGVEWNQSSSTLIPLPWVDYTGIHI